MNNPWNDISLDDYEGHMTHGSVMQLQAMNAMMREQLECCHGRRVMILGVAGGNGLEHITPDSFDRVYGIDINPDYLKETLRRYAHLGGALEGLCVDLTKDADKLPRADSVIANLLVEYIGCDCLQGVLERVSPEFFSCIIQVNPEGSWVSSSPYIHAFDGLDSIHHSISTEDINKAVGQLGFVECFSSQQKLPNGKKLIRLDYIRARKHQTLRGSFRFHP